MRDISLSNVLFSKNREKIKNNLNAYSIAFVNSNDKIPRNGDQYYPYRQNSDFFYLTGINQEKSILVLSPGYPELSQREMLFIAKPDKSKELWNGMMLTLERAREISGIQSVFYIDDFEKITNKHVCRATHLYFNLMENNRFSSEIKFRDERLYESVKSKFPLHKYERLAPILNKYRLIKDELEIKCLSKACDITGKAFQRILRKTHPGLMEYEIEAEVLYEFLLQGANGHAFAPIIATGENACILHYHSNNSVCNNGDLLLVDFGAEYGNYASDCSRTIPVNGKFSPRQRDMYNAVLRVFRYARSLMVPGNSIAIVHEKVCKMWEKEHIGLGLYTIEDVKSNIYSPLWNKYYMHSTSHFIGLDVHDPGDKSVIFEPGMVVSCEPGIYVPGENLGIRIENEILITGDGPVDLMEHIPIEADEIERYMKG